MCKSKKTKKEQAPGTPTQRSNKKIGESKLQEATILCGKVLKNETDTTGNSRKKPEISVADKIIHNVNSTQTIVEGKMKNTSDIRTSKRFEKAR